MLQSIKGSIKNLLQKKKYIDEIVRKTGWSNEEASKMLDEAVNNLGISYRDYVRAKYYLLTPEEQIKKSKNVLKKRKHKEEKAIEGVMNATGWDREHTEEMILEAQKRTGCTYKEFYIYRFYELSKEEAIEIKCEFCNKEYKFDKKDIELIMSYADRKKEDQQ